MSDAVPDHMYVSGFMRLLGFCTTAVRRPSALEILVMSAIELLGGDRRLSPNFNRQLKCVVAEYHSRNRCLVGQGMLFAGMELHGRTTS